MNGLTIPRRDCERRCAWSCELIASKTGGSECVEGALSLMLFKQYEVDGLGIRLQS